MNAPRIIAALLAAACCAFAQGAWADSAVDPLGAAVKTAYGRTMPKLVFPANADDVYKAKGAEMLAGCLNSCLVEGGSLHGTVAQQGCEAACLCISNGLMESLGFEFAQSTLSPAAQAKGTEVSKQCIDKYKIN